MEDNGDIYRPWQRSLSILYLALLSGQVMFAIIVAVLTGDHSSFKLNPTDPMTITMIIVTVTAIPAGHFIFSRFLARAREEALPFEKMNLYRQGFIIRCATNEFVSLFAIIQVLLSHSLAYYAFLAVSLFFFAMANPTLEKVKRQLSIDNG